MCVLIFLSNYQKCTNLILAVISQVQLNEKSLQKVTLVNGGKFDCLYDWKLTVPPKFDKTPSIITVTPSSGVIKPGSRTFCDVAFCPPHKLTLRDFTAVCEVNLDLDEQLWTLSKKPLDPKLKPFYLLKPSYLLKSQTILLTAPWLKFTTFTWSNETVFISN